jgi:mono/diheme cytochrome c family protein
MRRSSTVARLLLLPFPLVLACGQEPIPNGEVLYRRLCASCHGVAGRGDGPAAVVLHPPPTDLTRVMVDVPELMRLIDGRTAISAHGSSAMPVWGQIFEQVHLDTAHAKRIAMLQAKALAEYVTTLSSVD